MNRRVFAIVAGALLGLISAYMLFTTWSSSGEVAYIWLLLLLCGGGLAVAESRRA